jgi:hypothetical protein
LSAKLEILVRDKHHFLKRNPKQGFSEESFCLNLENIFGFHRESIIEKIIEETYGAGGKYFRRVYKILTTKGFLTEIMIRDIACIKKDEV